MFAAQSLAQSSAACLDATWAGESLHLFAFDRRADGAMGEGPPASHDRLQALLGELAADNLLASAASASRQTFWLRAPQSDGPAQPKAKDVAWVQQEAPTLALAPADAIDFLVALDPGVLEKHGESIVYWQTLARFMLDLLAQQRFCPAVIETIDNRFLARWRLMVRDPKTIQWLERVVGAMPPVCRAIVSDECPPRAAVMVEEFLAKTADAFVRRSLAGDGFFQQIPAKAREVKTWELFWLAALVTNDPKVAADPEANITGTARVEGWVGQEDEVGGDVPRLALTLQEPAESAAARSLPWRLRFDLISPETDEPLDLAQVWSERDGAVTILGSHLATRRQHLVTQLTQVAEIVPEISKSLARSGATGVDLTAAEALAFIRERAPVLAAQNFEVNLPDWVPRLDQRLGLRLDVRPLRESSGGESSGGMGLGALLAFDWKAAVGEHDLTLEEFEKLVDQKAPLVKLREQWIHIDRDAASAALRFMKEQTQSPITLLEAMRLSAGMQDVETGLPVIGMTGAEWIEHFLRNTPDIEAQALAPPETFKGTLRPYQSRGLQWLAFMDRLGIGACLADDMGLGKTIQLLALLLHERAGGRRVGPTLLFAPMSIVGNWEREIERFAPVLRPLVFHGPDRPSGDAFEAAATQADVVITTYGLAAREADNFGRVQWHRIAMDEAQKIKNPTASQTVALRALRAEQRVALTGTPVENHLSELWSILDMLNPGVLGSASRFRTHFAVPIEKGGDQHRAEQLRRLIRPFVLRRLKSDPAVACDLPEKMEMRVFCNLTPEQAALYERTVADTLRGVDAASGIRRRGLILAALTKLKQICNHPAHFLKAVGPLDGRSGKCERLVEMLEEVLEEGDCALVFTQFREMGVLLEKLLADRLRMEIPFLHGGTPMKKRNEMILEFQRSASPWRLFLLSLKAGGFGLNLTRANHVFHFDRWWNPAVEEQAADRVHRIGQTRRVQVHKFVCIGTMEERIDRLLQDKIALADKIVGSGDEWLTGLSTSELRDYLKLSSEAVAEW